MKGEMFMNCRQELGNPCHSFVNREVLKRAYPRHSQSVRGTCRHGVVQMEEIHNSYELFSTTVFVYRSMNLKPEVLSSFWFDVLILNDFRKCIFEALRVVERNEEICFVMNEKYATHYVHFG